jgi:hypothetical protein
LRFEANAALTDTAARFLARGNGYELALTASEVVLALRTAVDAASPGTHATPKQASLVRLRFLGATPGARVLGEEQLPGTVNYFRGSEPARWRTKVPVFGRVRCEQIYPGIDLIYYGNQRQVEHDFLVAPGADPKQIAMTFDGVDDVKLDPKGNLRLHAGEGEVILQAPIAYQIIDGARHEVAAAFALTAHGSPTSLPDRFASSASSEAHATPNTTPTRPLVTFGLGPYDPTHVLIIDPILSYSTLLGGVNNEFGWNIAVDAQGFAYLTGATFSVSDFPTTAGSAQPTFGGGAAGADAFVTKIAPDGKTLVYSTSLGGPGNDFGLDIAVDGQGNAYIVGTSYAVSQFPTTDGAYQTRFGGGVADAFVAKLSPDGAQLLYATYLGGSQFDGGTDQFTSPDIFDSFWHMGIAVDRDGNAFIAGTTLSPNFPVTDGAFQKLKAGAGPSDAFVAKLNAAGSALLYATYLGGASGELGSDIAIDNAGNAYVVGATGSLDFPTTDGAFQQTTGSPGNAFLTKLNPSGSGLVFSTYLGGSDNDEADAVVVDHAGQAYVTGFTTVTPNEPFFPSTSGAYRTRHNGGSLDGFVTKFSADGSRLIYSTFIGGAQNEHGNAIALSPSGSVFVVGHTRSPDFPVEQPIQTYPNDGNLTGFILRLSPDGSALEFSTYLGGNQFEDTMGVAVGPGGDVFAVGYTEVTVNPPHFPTTPGSFQETHKGNADAFIVRVSGFGGGPVTPPEVAIARDGDKVTITWPATPDGFRLEGASSLAPPIDWQPVTTPAILLGDQRSVTETATDQAKYYRVRRP